MLSTDQGNYSATGFAAGTRIPVLSGPGAQYAAVSELPADASGIWVNACDTNPGDPYAWCMVSWRNVAGWVYGAYLLNGMGHQPVAVAAAPPPPPPPRLR